LQNTLDKSGENGHNNEASRRGSHTVPALTSRAVKGSDDMADSDSTTGRAPAFQFYPKDFLSDRNVVLMSMQERGVYITLICYAWEGPLPVQVERLARLCGIPLSAFRKLWPMVGSCFREQDGSLVHPRLEREREKQAEFKRRQSDNGKKGGRPVKPTESQNYPSLSSGLSQTEPRKSSASAFASSSSSSDSSVKSLTERAGEFCEWYADEHSTILSVGYIGNPQNDYRRAQELCLVFGDQELRDAAIVWFGQTDKFATEGTRTIGKFASRASDLVKRARKVTA
jgi:uncharacterized protein YdaU (DUF1376 family)